MIRRLLAALGPCAAVWAIASALVWLTGAPAAAHASLLSTAPADGSVVATTPQQVVFTFNEPIRLDTDAVHAFGPDGSDWKVTAEATANKVVVTPAEDPGTGTVVVAWEVISTDGHKVSGALTLSIGSASAGGPDAGGTPTTPASVSALRWLAAGIAGLGLVVAAALALARRRADLVWNLGFGAAVLLAPLHQLAEDGRGLRGLTDWLTWVDGVARSSSLLLLAGYAVAAAASSLPRRVAAAVTTVTALVLLGGAACFWPQAQRAPATSATPTGPTTATADLGASGTVRLTTDREAGRAVSIQLAVLDTHGQPLSPYAPPTLTIRNDHLSLGDATLTATGPGTYHAEVTVPRNGAWTAQVSVRTSEFDNPVATVSFTVS